MDKLLTYLKPIYKTAASRINNELVSVTASYEKNVTRLTDPFWYKFIELYTVYPDGVVYDKTISPLKNLLAHIPHIKQLGCNAVHILPFLASPQVDRGFDVSDYYQVRKDLGDLSELITVKQAAEKQGIQLFMDLVVNHVSNQHQWFQQAQQGNEKYRNYFIYTKRKPAFLRKYHRDNAVWAEYNVNGKLVEVNIAFPEYAGAIPHWRQGQDGYWYYHTYYPQQLDLNWLNPDVFIDIAKVVLYWSSLGFNFRLDAIPFVGKAAYKILDDNNNAVHLITAALKNIATAVNPTATFIVETYEALDRVIEYFGTSHQIQANLSYNFHLCTQLWVALVKGDTQYIWQTLARESDVPKHAEWLNFLRNHDELSLAYLSDELTQDVRQSILKYGKDFREGYGVAGRTFALLGHSVKRFLMAYFLAASLPGGIVIVYGDEIAAVNIVLNKLSDIERKDSRNINRGVFSAEQFNQAEAKTTCQALAAILAKRKQLRDYLNIWPTPLPAPADIFAASYKLGSSEMIIFINLANVAKEIAIELNNFKKIAQVNFAKVVKGGIRLGAYGGIWLER